MTTTDPNNNTTTTTSTNPTPPGDIPGGFNSTYSPGGGPGGGNGAPGNSGFNSSMNAQPPRVDPLMLDLDGDGIETTHVKDGAYFDHDGNGFAEQTGWVGHDDGAGSK